MTDLTPPSVVDVSGVIHCHSTFSDGTEPIERLAAWAGEAGLDYLLMTDHDTLAPLTEVGEQWMGNTLLLLGCEITPRQNHYLAYGIDQVISPHLPPAEYTAAVAAQGGIGFLAHPVEFGSRIIGQNSYSWEDWSVTEYTGVEIWNYFSEWVGSCTSLPATLRTLVNWRRAIRAPYDSVLAKWDELGQHRRVVGIGGLDAHGVKRRLLGLTICLHPYLRAFRSVRTHLLLPTPFTRDVGQDRILVMNALWEGSCYVANHEEGDPTGFTFVGRQKAQWVPMGAEATLSRPGATWLSARIPAKAPRASLRLLHNGKVIAETHSHDLQAPDQGPGVYRVEAWRNGRGWIFSNPIYLR